MQIEITHMTEIECPECGDSCLANGTAVFAGTLRGESFDVQMEALLCPQCGFKTIPANQVEEFARRTADCYRTAQLKQAAEIETLNQRMARMNQFLQSLSTVEGKRAWHRNGIVWTGELGAFSIDKFLTDFHTAALAAMHLPGCSVPQLPQDFGVACDCITQCLTAPKA